MNNCPHCQAELSQLIAAGEHGDDRTLLATSHDGKFSYWLAGDRYVYQFNEVKREWNGWFCSQPAWESTFCKSLWMTLAEVAV